MSLQEMKPLKETYFTPATIVDKALNMRDSLENFTRKRSTQFTPERSALLLLDMQVYFLNETSHAFVPSATAILPGVNALIRAYSCQNLPVLFTRHLNTPQDAGLMATWWRELLAADNPLSRIDPRLEIHNAVTISK